MDHQAALLSYPVSNGIVAGAEKVLERQLSRNERAVDAFVHCRQQLEQALADGSRELIDTPAYGENTKRTRAEVVYELFSEPGGMGRLEELLSILTAVRNPGSTDDPRLMADLWISIVAAQHASTHRDDMLAAWEASE